MGKQLLSLSLQLALPLGLTAAVPCRSDSKTLLPRVRIDTFQPESESEGDTDTDSVVLKENAGGGGRDVLSNEPWELLDGQRGHSTSPQGQQEAEHVRWRVRHVGGLNDIVLIVPCNAAALAWVNRCYSRHLEMRLRGKR